MRFTRELIKKAHEMAKKIKAEYPEVDYRLQFGLNLKYLLSEIKGDDKMETEITLREIKGIVAKLAETESIDEINYYEKGNTRRLYLNRYTGAGYRKAIGTIMVEQDGSMRVDKTKDYTNAASRVWAEIEGRIFK